MGLVEKKTILSFSPFIPVLFDLQENISNREGMYCIEAVFHQTNEAVKRKKKKKKTQD